MSNSRNLASLGTIVTSTSAKNVSFANTVSNGFATAASTNTVNLNVTGNSNLTYILANNSQGTAGQLLISGGSTTNVSWSSFSTLLNYSTIAVSNAITFNNTSTYNGTATYNSTVTFANAVTFSNTISVANINNSYISNTTFLNYKEQSYTNTAIGATYTVDLNNGSMQLITLDATTTISMPAVSAGKSFTMIISSGTGGYAVTWNGVTWPEGITPTLTATASKKDLVSFVSDGSTWYGMLGGMAY
jgi:hypothetical protein